MTLQVTENKSKQENFVRILWDLFIENQEMLYR